MGLGISESLVGSILGSAGLRFGGILGFLIGGCSMQGICCLLGCSLGIVQCICLLVQRLKDCVCLLLDALGFACEAVELGLGIGSSLHIGSCLGLGITGCRIRLLLSLRICGRHRCGVGISVLLDLSLGHLLRVLLGEHGDTLCEVIKLAVERPLLRGREKTVLVDHGYSINVERHKSHHHCDSH